MLNCRKPSDPTYTAVSFNSTDPINSSCMRLLCELPEAPQAAPLARHAAQSAPCPMPLSPSLHSFHPTGDPNRRVGATADLCGLHGASVAATNHFVRTEVDYLDVDWRALMFVVSRSLFCKVNKLQPLHGTTLTQPAAITQQGTASCQRDACTVALLHTALPRNRSYA